MELTKEQAQIAYQAFCGAPGWMNGVKAACEAVLEDAQGADERLTADDWGVIKNAVETLEIWVERDYFDALGRRPMWNPTLRTLRNLLAKRPALNTALAPPAGPLRRRR